MKRIKIIASDGEKISFLFSNTSGKTNTPCILFIHGGGWNSCSADYYLRHMKSVNDRGSAAASAEYRLKTGDIPISRCIEDCADIMRYIRSHSCELGINPKKICVIGESAGGHLALCLATPYIVRDPIARPDLVVNLNGVVDMTATFRDRFFFENELNDFSSPDKWLKRYEIEESFSPIYHVDTNNSPTIHIQGLADPVVKPEETYRYHKALLAVGVKSEIIFLPNLSHAFILFDYQYPDDTVQEIVDMMCDKLNEYGYLEI